MAKLRRMGYIKEAYTYKYTIYSEEMVYEIYFRGVNGMSIVKGILGKKMYLKYNLPGINRIIYLQNKHIVLYTLFST